MIEVSNAEICGLPVSLKRRGSEYLIVCDRHAPTQLAEPLLQAIASGALQHFYENSAVIIDTAPGKVIFQTEDEAAVRSYFDDLGKQLATPQDVQNALSKLVEWQKPQFQSRKNGFEIGDAHITNTKEKQSAYRRIACSEGVSAAEAENIMRVIANRLEAKFDDSQPAQVAYDTQTHGLPALIVGPTNQGEVSEVLYALQESHPTAQMMAHAAAKLPPEVRIAGIPVRITQQGEEISIQLGRRGQTRTGYSNPELSPPLELFDVICSRLAGSKSTIFRADRVGLSISTSSCTQAEMVDTLTDLSHEIKDSKALHHVSHRGGAIAFAGANDTTTGVLATLMKGGTAQYTTDQMGVLRQLQEKISAALRQPHMSGG